MTRIPLTHIGSGDENNPRVGQLFHDIDRNIIETYHDSAFSSVGTPEGYVNVKDFGAKGDGVTDDTEAIQAAIDANPKVFFPDGEYIIEDTIYLPRSFEFKGSLTGMTYASSYAPESCMISARFGEEVTEMFKPKDFTDSKIRTHAIIRDIAFNGNEHTSQLRTCFYGFNFRRTLIYNILIKHVGYAFRSSFSFVSVIRDSTFIGLTKSFIDTQNFIGSEYILVDSFVSGNYINGRPFFTNVILFNGQIAHSTISNNYIDFAYIGIYMRNGTTNANIIGNIIDVCYRGIYSNVTYNYSIIGNSFTNCHKNYLTSWTNNTLYEDSNLSDMSTKDWCGFTSTGMRSITLSHNNFKLCNLAINLWDIYTNTINSKIIGNTYDNVDQKIKFRIYHDHLGRSHTGNIFIDDLMYQQYTELPNSRTTILSTDEPPTDRIVAFNNQIILLNGLPLINYDQKWYKFDGTEYTQE